MTFGYDPTNQLLSEVRSGPVAVSNIYAYDPLGNRLTMNQSGAVTSYTHNAANAMTLIQPPSGAPTTNTFDANGNMTGQNAGGALTTLTWDFENRMAARSDPTNGTLTNTYDADGARVQLITPSATTLFVRDGENVLQETNASGVLAAQYTDNPGYWAG